MTKNNVLRWLMWASIVNVGVATLAEAPIESVTNSLLAACVVVACALETHRWPLWVVAAIGPGAAAHAAWAHDWIWLASDVIVLAGAALTHFTVRECRARKRAVELLAPLLAREPVSRATWVFVDTGTYRAPFWRMLDDGIESPRVLYYLAKGLLAGLTTTEQWDSFLEQLSAQHYERLRLFLIKHEKKPCPPS